MSNAGTPYPANPRLVTDSDNAQLDAILDHVVAAVQLTATQYESAKQKYGAVAEWLGAENSLVRVLNPPDLPAGQPPH
jgi:hypothetical protein